MSTSLPINRSDNCTLVLIGRKGDGKSATGNTILGQPCFAASLTGANSLTACVKQTTKIIPNFKEVTVIDTPGLFNTETPKHEVETELARIFELAPGGVDAFLLVLRVGRFTPELHNTIKYFKELFGSGVMKYTIVVFAGLDDLEFDGETFESYLEQMPKDIMKSLPKRRVGFDNRSKSTAEKQQQVGSLLAQVAQMGNKTKYTGKAFRTKAKPHESARPIGGHGVLQENMSAEKQRAVNAHLRSPGSSRGEQVSSPQQSASPSPRRNTKKEEVIQQLKLAVVGEDSVDFLDTIHRTFVNFKVEERIQSSQCISHTGKITGQNILLVDVGNLKAKDNDQEKPKVVDSLYSRVSGGIHAFILNIRVGTSENDMILLINSFKRIFGDDAMKYTALVFSNSSRISKFGTDVANYSNNLHESVKNLLKNPIANDLIFAFDEQDSNVAFAIGLEKFTSKIDKAIKSRQKKEREFKYEMTPNFSHDDGWQAQVGRRRSTLGEIVSARFRRVRARCVIA